MLKERSGELEAMFLPLLDNKSELLAKMQVMAGSVKVDRVVGPVKINQENKKIVQELAASYWCAFSKGTQVFPYFEEGITSWE